MFLVNTSLSILRLSNDTKTFNNFIIKWNTQKEYLLKYVYDKKCKNLAIPYNSRTTRYSNSIRTSKLED